MGRWQSSHLPQARIFASPTWRTRSNRPRVGPLWYAIHRFLLARLTSSLKGAARDDHRQNLISPLTNRGENPTSKKVDLRCHRGVAQTAPLRWHLPFEIVSLFLSLLRLRKGSVQFAWRSESFEISLLSTDDISECLKLWPALSNNVALYFD